MTVPFRALLIVTVLGASAAGCSRSEGAQVGNQPCPPCGDPSGEISRFSGPRFPDFEPVAPRSSGRVAVFGYVRSSSDSIALEGVQIYAEGTPIGVLSAVDGRYQLEVPDSLATRLALSLVGYVRESLPLRANVSSQRIDVELRQCAVCLMY